jgi:hypothetical protein
MVDVIPLVRVAESSTTPGMGVYLLDGPLAGCYSFSTQIANGKVVSYSATDGVRVEYGRGTFTAPNLLSRDEILSSSEGNDKINWSNFGQRIIEISTEIGGLIPIGGEIGDQLRKFGVNDYDSRWEGSPYPIAVCFPGNLSGGNDDNRTRARIIITERIKFLSNFQGSYSWARIMPSGNVSLEINKILINNSSVLVGNLVILTGQTIGSFTTVGEEEKIFNFGEMIEILAPVSADATLLDLSLTLKGKRI